MQPNNAEYTGTLIAEISALVESRSGPCENVLGQTSLDPGAGDPCGRKGMLRADERILCDRCWKAVL